MLRKYDENVTKTSNASSDKPVKKYQPTPEEIRLTKLNEKIKNEIPLDDEIKIEPNKGQQLTLDSKLFSLAERSKQVEEIKEKIVTDQTKIMTDDERVKYMQQADFDLQVTILKKLRENIEEGKVDVVPSGEELIPKQLGEIHVTLRPMTNQPTIIEKTKEKDNKPKEDYHELIPSPQEIQEENIESIDLEPEPVETEPSIIENTFPMNEETSENEDDTSTGDDRDFSSRRGRGRRRNPRSQLSRSED